jgi:hypothetical protein
MASCIYLHARSFSRVNGIFINVFKIGPSLVLYISVSDQETSLIQGSSGLSAYM